MVHDKGKHKERYYQQKKSKLSITLYITNDDKIMNRNTYQITEDILDNILLSGEHGITITPLLRQSNLPYKRANGFLHKLTESNLVNEILVHKKKVFIITQRGKVYLEKYKQFNTIAESFGLEL